MTKRQLNDKYRDLVDYVSSKTDECGLAEILTSATKEAIIDYHTDSKLGIIIESLYITPLADDEVTDLFKVIIDIYTGNYEIKENKYYWKFLPAVGDYGVSIYLSRMNDYNNRLTDSKDSTSQFTPTEFNTRISGTKLTADMFQRIRVEED